MRPASARELSKPSTSSPHTIRTVGCDLASLHERCSVRETLAKGDVGEALQARAPDWHRALLSPSAQKVNSLNPDVLEMRPELLFALQRQRLIELIRAGELLPALDFASTSLLPLAREDASGRLMALLESTLALLAFPDPASQPAAASLIGQLSPEARAELGAFLCACQRCECAGLSHRARRTLREQRAARGGGALRVVTAGGDAAQDGDAAGGAAGEGHGASGLAVSQT